MQVLHNTAKISRIGNRLIKISGGIAAVILLLFGIYTIWYVSTIYSDGSNLGHEEYKPGILGEGKTYSLAELKKINQDVIGWISIDGTGIDYPLLQGESNQEYLTKNLYGDYSLAGSIFLDATNSSKFLDDYSVIYGHHMEKGAMFGDILRFFEEDYFNEHSKGYIVLPDKTMEIEFVAILDVDGHDYTALSPISDFSEKPQFLEYLENNAVIKSKTLGNIQGRLVGLVTCKNGNTNGRALLIGQINEN